MATYQNVVWLDVPVDEAHLVHAVHSADQLGDVEPGRKIVFYGETKIGNSKEKVLILKVS